MAAKSDVGVLTVYMDAVTDQFHAGLQGAEKRITSFRGKIKGLNRTFTEVKNKVHVVSGVLESAFKGVEVVAKRFKADLQGATDIIKQLPFGIGAVMTAFESMLLVVTGQAEQQERIEASIKRQQGHARDLGAILKNQSEALDASAERSAALYDARMLALVELNEGPEVAGELAKAMKDNAAVNSLKKQITSLEEGFLKTTAKAAEAVTEFAVAQAKVKALTAAGPYAEQEPWTTKHALRLKRRHAEELSAAKETMETRRMVLELQRASVTSQENSLDAYRQELKDLKSLHVMQGEIVDKAKDKAKEEGDAADAMALQLELAAELNKLDAARKTRARILHRGLQGSANTFTSPMGTISLPALNTTAELARQQLTELRAIEQTITGLEATIKDLTKP